MKKSIQFNRAQFAELFHALRDSHCLEEDIPHEELVRIFAEAVSTDTPEDEVFQTITSTGHYEGFEAEEPEEELEYIEDDFEDFDDSDDFSQYEEYELTA